VNAFVGQDAGEEPVLPGIARDIGFDGGDFHLNRHCTTDCYAGNLTLTRCETASGAGPRPANSEFRKFESVKCVEGTLAGRGPAPPSVIRGDPCIGERSDTICVHGK
jgi:hypothetical protein